MRPIRVMHLVHMPGPGGTEAVVSNLLSWMPPGVVQALACPPGALAESAPCSVRVYPVPFTLVRRSRSPLSMARGLRRVGEVVSALERALADFQPHIVHAHAAKAAILASRCPSRTRWSLIWHLHDYLPLGPLRSLWIARARDAADSILAVSHDVARCVGGRRPVVIHNALPDMAVAGPDEGRRVRESLGLPESTPLLGYAGRLDREKGVGTLLEVFRMVLREAPSAHLLIAGWSAFGETGLVALRRLSRRLGVEGSVHFLGRVPNLASLYRALTVFTHPAPREPFGLVILEALASGVPVVAFRSGGPREILDDFDPSLTVPVGDLEAYAQTVCRLLSDDAMRRRVAEEGPRYVRERFSPEAHCTALLAHYGSLMRP